MILVIDNYDSFTYNLVDILRRGSRPVKVIRNDELSLQELEELKPAGLLISPGPGRPSDSGISQDALRVWAGKLPILGICLGHQLIGEWAGGKLVHAGAPMHGKTSTVEHSGKGLFEGLPKPMTVMRYHSLLLEAESLPSELEVTARTPEGEIMGIQHKKFNLAGVQFHPESILSQEGDQLVRNWMEKL